MAAVVGLATVLRRLHHGVVALLFACVVLVVTTVACGLLLMGMVAVLDLASLGRHVPMQYLGVMIVIVGLIDVGVAAWSAVWGYRLMQRPVEAVA